LHLLNQETMMKLTVNEYVLKHQNWQVELETLRKIILQADLKEEIKWGAPVYTVAGKNIVGLGAFKKHVALWFFQGALLKDEDKVLFNAQEDKTKAMRQWRFTSVKEIDVKAVKKYVNEAVANQKQGREIEVAKPTAAVIPDELLALLRSDQILKKSFDGLTPYKQKEYAVYIAEAKRMETKISRLEKIAPMILAGVGLNDRYR
jgi:uncharacterized protein YdeI (YjbR/CyaY-like superfamily)